MNEPDLTRERMIDLAEKISDDGEAPWGQVIITLRDGINRIDQLALRASEARAQALEQAAKVCDELQKKRVSIDGGPVHIPMPEYCAAAIREQKQ